MKKNWIKALTMLACVGMVACSYGPKEGDFEPSGEFAYEDISGEPSGGEGNGQGNSDAGKLTSGEWRDLNHWNFWSSLINGQNDAATGQPVYWGYYTNCRIATRVTNEQGQPQCGVNLTLKDAEGNILWNAVTDNKGEANLWPQLYKMTEDFDSVYVITVGEMNAKAYPTLFGDTAVRWNEYTMAAPEQSGSDILFIVDATGSMGDEIYFLKQDLLDILNKANVPDAQVGALFYRDEGDEYVTKVSNLNSDFVKTTTFISEQDAGGGGDYPEAVHTALAAALQDVSWRSTARVKLAFLLLDAPPHKQDAVISSLHQSTQLFAANGIRVIPIAASGVDKPTEFFLRFLAITTDGTYTFLTNDSGIGNDHIEPTIGDYQVELLNEMVLRLIKEYTK